MLTKSAPDLKLTKIVVSDLRDNTFYATLHVLSPAGPRVVEAMVETYRHARDEKRELSERLVLTLEAGQAAGGDKRGKQSAALLVASREPRGYHNLRVDDHPDPVADLRRIYDLVVQHSLKIEREYGPEGLRLFSRVKY